MTQLSGFTTHCQNCGGLLKKEKGVRKNGAIFIYYDGKPSLLNERGDATVTLCKDCHDGVINYLKTLRGEKRD